MEWMRVHFGWWRPRANPSRVSLLFAGAMAVGACDPDASPEDEGGTSHGKADDLDDEPESIGPEHYGYASEVIKPGESAFFARSAEVVNEIQLAVQCDASGGAWTSSQCAADGRELELGIGGPQDTRADRCAALGGTWSPGSCDVEPEVPIARGFHNKGHMCARASFRVLEGAPEKPAEAHAGPLFEHEGECFAAWVRFSNGHPAFNALDSMPDFRGLAIKVMGVEGPRVMQDDVDSTTQDFLMLNNPMMAAPDGETFMHFTKRTAPPRNILDLQGFLFDLVLGRYRDDPEYKDNIFLAGAEAFDPRLSTGTFEGRTGDFLRNRVMGQLAPGNGIRSMAEESFWSGSAIRYGDRFARYSVVPCADPTPGAACENATRRGRPSRLSDELFGRLSLEEGGQGVRYVFFVQLQQEDGTPLEDASDPWTPEESTPFAVAELVLEPRSEAVLDAQDEACEPLRFTPFHAVQDYEPVGSINRIRRAVYAASQRLRDGAPEPRADDCSGPGCDVCG